MLKVLKEICYCGHPLKSHIGGQKKEDAGFWAEECYHCVCKRYIQDEQYTKQEEETVKEGCADCPHDATPTNTDKDTITCSNTPIVEECTPGNCPYSGGGTMGGGVMGWGGSPSFFQEMKARHDRYHQ